MGNSIYLGGGIKSAFCGGNVKEIYQGGNKLFPSGVEPVPGYEQVDYLEHFYYLQLGENFAFYNNSTNLIASTLATSDVYELKFEWNSSSNYALSLTRHLNNEKSGFQIGLYKNDYTSVSNYRYNGTKWTYNLYEGAKWTANPFDCTFTKRQKTFTFNEQTKSYSWGDCYAEGGINMLLQVASGTIGTKFFSFKAWDSTLATLKHDIVPARRKSDGNPFFIDLVTKEVFESDARYFKAVKA